MSGANIHDLEDLLQVIKDSANRSEVSVGDILDHVGRRSFGPFLLFIGIAYVAPVIGDIPGVPTMLGALLFLVALQLLVGREHIWLPDLILRRSVRSEKVIKAIGYLEKPARYVDKLIKPRLHTFAGSMAVYIIICVSAALALVTPVMEVVPFSANVIGFGLLFFGLGIVAKDGFLNVLGMLCVLGVVGFLVYLLL